MGRWWCRLNLVKFVRLTLLIRGSVNAGRSRYETGVAIVFVIPISYRHVFLT